MFGIYLQKEPKKRVLMVMIRIEFDVVFEGNELRPVVEKRTEQQFERHGAGVADKIDKGLLGNTDCCKRISKVLD